MAKIQQIDATASIFSLKETHCKCPRCRAMTKCWGNFGHLKHEIEADPKLAREKLCQRCCDSILTDFPLHESADFIKLYQEKEKIFFKETGGFIDSFEKATIWV